MPRRPINVNIFMTWGDRSGRRDVPGCIHIYMSVRVCVRYGMGFRRGLDGTWTAHNSLFGSSLQFKKAFVSALFVISRGPPSVAANNANPSPSPKVLALPPTPLAHRRPPLVHVVHNHRAGLKKVRKLNRVKPGSCLGHSRERVKSPVRWKNGNGRR